MQAKLPENSLHTGVSGQDDLLINGSGWRRPRLGRTPLGGEGRAGRWQTHPWGVEWPGGWRLGQQRAGARAAGAGGTCGWGARVTRGRPEQVLAPDAGERGSVATH